MIRVRKWKCIWTDAAKQLRQPSREQGTTTGMAGGESGGDAMSADPQLAVAT